MKYLFFKGAIRFRLILKDLIPGTHAIAFHNYGLAYGDGDLECVQDWDKFNKETGEYEGDYCQLFAIKDEKLLNSRISEIKNNIKATTENDSVEIVDAEFRNAKKLEIEKAREEAQAAYLKRVGKA